MRIKFFASIAIQLALALVINTNAHAQQVKNFGNVGSWKVDYGKNVCLAAPSDTNNPLITIVGNHAGVYTLILSLGHNAPWVKNGQNYPITFKLDNRVDLNGVGVGNEKSKNNYDIIFYDIPPKYLNQFVRSNGLVIAFKDGPQSPEMPLKGSLSALKMLRQCMVQKLSVKL